MTAAATADRNTTVPNPTTEEQAVFFSDTVICSVAPCVIASVSKAIVEAFVSGTAVIKKSP